MMARDDVLFHHRKYLDVFYSTMDTIRILLLSHKPLDWCPNFDISVQIHVSGCPHLIKGTNAFSGAAFLHQSPGSMKSVWQSQYLLPSTLAQSKPIFVAPQKDDMPMHKHS
jgi:hypothetical protein